MGVRTQGWLQSPQCSPLPERKAVPPTPDLCFWVTWSSSLTEGFEVDLGVPGKTSLPQLKGSKSIRVSAEWGNAVHEGGGT